MATSPATRHLTIDLEHLGRPESIAAALLPTVEGPLLVDPGPTSTLPRLRAGLREAGYELGDLRAILLTHIHLDHAGATGTIARELPGLPVYVHSQGAPHVIDPGKLLASATRLYGERMYVLWGEVAATPAGQVVTLDGGERLGFGERVVEVAYTPGHAWHHVSYFDSGSGTAFVGDTAGLRTPRLPMVIPVTPPPDFDLEAWLASLDRIAGWRPRELFLTHFGASPEPAAHLEALRAGLSDWAGYGRESLERPGSDAERVAWFTRKLEAWLDGRVDPSLAGAYLGGAGPEACWRGLARYWSRRAEAR